MRSSLRLTLGFCAAVVMAVPSYAQSIIIDTFETDQSVTLVSPGDSGNFVDGTGILQTERNMFVQALTVGPGGEVTGAVGAGAFNVTRTINATGTVMLWWDGNNSTTTLDLDNLGGINLTAGGQDRFRITTGATSSTTLNFRLTVFTDGSNSSIRNFTLPAVPGAVDLLYSSFSLSSGIGANFASVGAITLSTVETSGFWTAQLDDIRTVPVELQSFSVD